MTNDDIFKKIAELLTSYLRLNPGEATPDSHIVNDLGADSLAMVELGFQFSEAFGIPMMNPTEENMILKNLVVQIKTAIENP
ncbi:MAG: acyl carrier protein [Deltaproteobacteria bacterium]|nr:acyl carrier protein [Deltaproteobacteria bacterium]